MKITWILDNINTLNGMVQVVVGLSNYFSEKGHEVRIYSVFSRESHPFFHLKTEVIVDNLAINWNTASRRSKHRLLGQLMESCDADILLTCNEWASTSGVLHKRKLKGKLIVTQHMSCDGFSGRRKLVNCLLHRYADEVTVLNPSDKRFYEKFGIRNVTVIPNAVYNRFEGNVEKQKVVCSVGRVETVKGFDMLISAFAQVAKDFPDWKLQIWGDGTQRQPLLSRIEELGLSEQIEMPGVTDRVAEKMSEASVYVMASRWEGLPLTLLEAMTAGDAIVAFALPCVEEILRPEFSFVVPQNDVDALAGALRKLMSDKVLCEKCGAAAQIAAEKFSVESIGTRWLALLERRSGNHV